MSSLDVLSTRPLALRTHTDVLTAQRLDLDYYLPERATAEAQVGDGRYRTATLNSLRRKDRPITDGIRRHDKSDSGVHLIRTQNLVGPSVDFGSTAFINEEWHRTSLKSEVLPRDLLVAIRGYLGAAAIVVEGSPRANINQHIARIGIDETKCSIRYLWSFLSSRVGRTILERYVTGTVQRGVTLPDLRALRVPLPDRRIQDFIGAKVELVERCGAAAEDHWQEAVGLFRSLFAWSVPPQFSLTSVPAVVELSGRLDPKYYRREYLDAVREITAYEHGWEPIGDLVAEVSNGVEYRQYCSDGVPYLTVTNVGDGDLDTDGAPRIPVDAPISDRGRIVESDVLVVRTGATIGQAAVVQRDAARAIISSHFIRLRLHKGDLEQGAWLAFFLNTDLGKALQFRIAYGAVQPQIGQDELLRLPVPRIKAETRRALVRGFLSRSALRAHAHRLVNEAKADVEALIEGTLDVQAILAGTLKPPTEDDIPGLAEHDA